MSDASSGKRLFLTAAGSGLLSRKHQLTGCRGPEGNSTIMLSRAQIKYIQSLRHKKYRQKFSQFVAEGDKIASEILSSGHLRISALYALDSWIGANSLTLDQKPGLQIQGITHQELSQISSLTTPHSVLVVAEIPATTNLSPRGMLSLLLENIQDPGNMGTLIRTADWFGIRNLYCSSGCADPYGPKTVQASMGSIARVEIMETNLGSLIQEHPGISSFAAVLNGIDINAFHRVKEGLILIGNESRGLTPELALACTHRVTVPRLGHAQSLNAAVAAGIICSRLCME